MGKLMSQSDLLVTAAKACLGLDEDAVCNVYLRNEVVTFIVSDGTSGIFLGTGEVSLDEWRKTLLGLI